MHLGLEPDLGLGVGPSYKPRWDHITSPPPETEALLGLELRPPPSLLNASPPCKLN